MIEAAKVNYEHSNIDARFILSDILDYEPRERYDMVISQAVLRHVEPDQPEYEALLDCCIKADHWDDEKTDRETEENIAYFMNHGMSRKEAEDYCRQQTGIVKHLKKNKGEVALTKFR